MKTLSYILNKYLNEGVLDANDVDARIQRIEGVATIRKILKSHSCESILKKHEWVDGTLNLVFRRGNCYIGDIQGIADDLRCKSINFETHLVVTPTTPMKNLHITAPGIEMERPCNIENCVLECTGGKAVSLIADNQGSIGLKHTNIDSFNLRMSGLNKLNFQGNNFDKVTNLTLTGIGSNIQKIVSGWGICEVENNYFDEPSNDEFDSSIDPLKDLGLDKYFKNLEELHIAIGASMTDMFICYVKGETYCTDTCGTVNSKKLNNGWTMYLLDNARQA